MHAVKSLMGYIGASGAPSPAGVLSVCMSCRGFEGGGCCPVGLESSCEADGADSVRQIDARADATWRMTLCGPLCHYPVQCVCKYSP